MIHFFFNSVCFFFLFYVVWLLLRLFLFPFLLLRFSAAFCFFSPVLCFYVFLLLPFS